MNWHLVLERYEAASAETIQEIVGAQLRRDSDALVGMGSQAAEASFHPVEDELISISGLPELDSELEPFGEASAPSAPRRSFVDHLDDVADDT
jgi:hypothetical protein